MTTGTSRHGTRGRRTTGHSFFAVGEHAIWVTSGALLIAMTMIVGLLLYVLYQGGSTFWPGAVYRIELQDGRVVAGEFSRSEYEPAEAEEERIVRRLIRSGNYDVNGTHFTWVSDRNVAGESEPDWFLVLERLAWGRFYGEPAAFLVDGSRAAETPEAVWELFLEHHEEIRSRSRERAIIERVDIGHLSRQIEEARLKLSGEARLGTDTEGYQQALAAVEAVERATEGQLAELRSRIRALDTENARFALVLRTAAGDEHTIALGDIVRAYAPNRMSAMEKLKLYGERWVEFLLDEPREANSEGGVFPALFGTAIMTLLMVLIVVPFGVLAALYLREYAKPGMLVTLVRIAVGNLAGVPSIVFGVFGLGFFCYLVGASIDQLLFADRLPNPTYGKGGLLWASLTLALLTLPVVIVATEEALAAVPASLKEGSYGCGASKWQTIRRIVLPRAMPGILTGMILAMARGAGEVAPLMLVGAVKLAPDLPVDRFAPFVHPERSFMHLGFHIYDLGFQSQNSEAAKPMVFTSTLLLIALIALLNAGAILLRSRLRRRFTTSQV
jgi:phosphate transport system permease protein